MIYYVVWINCLIIVFFFRKLVKIYKNLSRELIKFKKIELMVERVKFLEFIIFRLKILLDY